LNFAPWREIILFILKEFISLQGANLGKQKNNNLHSTWRPGVKPFLLMSDPRTKQSRRAFPENRARFVLFD
jgi:hypothetical protein